MALLHPQSCECVKGQLDLFSVPLTQTSVEAGKWIEFRPLNNISEGGAIEFNVSSSHYLDLVNSYFVIKAQIKNQDGSNLLDNAPVAPTNLWAHALFSQIELSLDDKLISASNSTYPYRAYLETLLSFGKDAKQGQLTSAIWFQDTPGQMNALVEANAGFLARQQITENSKLVCMTSRPHLDFFNQQRYLLSNVKLRLKLIQSKEAFHLMAANNSTYKTVIKSISLFVRQANISPTVSLAHTKALMESNAKYPIRRVSVKSFTVSRGNMSANQENLFLGQLPKRIVIGCVSNVAFNGTRTENPFNFQNFGINFLALYKNGEQIPSKPLQPNFTSGDYIRSYLSLFTATGKFQKDQGNDIKYNDYPSGFTLFAFDLSPDLSNDGTLDLVENGTLRLEIRFNQGLAQTINVIVYGEFDNILQIDKDRHVIFDYSV